MPVWWTTLYVSAASDQANAMNARTAVVRAKPVGAPVRRRAASHPGRSGMRFRSQDRATTTIPSATQTASSTDPLTPRMCSITLAIVPKDRSPPGLPAMSGQDRPAAPPGSPQRRTRRKRPPPLAGAVERPGLVPVGAWPAVQSLDLDDCLRSVGLLAVLDLPDELLNRREGQVW